jgi:hypothetical protein
VQVDRVLEALAIWEEEKEKRAEHSKLCAAAGKEVRVEADSTSLCE